MTFSSIRRAMVLFCGAALLAGCVSEQKYDQLQAAYAQLQAAYSADQAEIVMLQGKLKVTMTDRILFPEGGYTLNPSAQSVLRKMVPTLTGLQQTNVVVEGYTDNVAIGPALKRIGVTSNLDLSSRRADTVADYLIKQGAPANIVSAQGRGEANPVAPNTTVEGRAQNRRIEVTLVGPGN